MKLTSEVVFHLGCCLCRLTWCRSRTNRTKAAMKIFSLGMKPQQKCYAESSVWGEKNLAHFTDHRLTGREALLSLEEWHAASLCQSNLCSAAFCGQGFITGAAGSSARHSIFQSSHPFKNRSFSFLSFKPSACDSPKNTNI